MDELWPGWETVELIGTGGFSKVYKIRKKEHEKTGEYESALKVISVPSSLEEYMEYLVDGYTDEEISEIIGGQVVKYVEEFRTMAKFKGHSNIVSYEDHIVVPHENGIGCDILIRMELLTSLAEFCMNSGLTIQDCVKIGIDVCRALEVCHSEKIIHRDIKPHNIFVNHYGDFKIGDFGIARSMERTTIGTKIGTFKYMAPEVYRGDKYNSTIDIYSLGLVLYWLLNEKRMPFIPLPPTVPSATMISEAQARRLSGDMFPPPKNGSENLKNIVLKACSFAPQDRYATAGELRNALEKEYAVVLAMPKTYVLNSEEKNGAATSAVRDDSVACIVDNGKTKGKNKRKIFAILGSIAGIAITAIIVLLLLRGCNDGVATDDVLSEIPSGLPVITIADPVGTTTDSPTSTSNSTEESLPAETATPTPSPTSTVSLPSSIEIGDSIKFGRYQQDNSTTNGAEILRWTVLAKEDNRILVVTTKAIECLQYNETFINLTWEESTIRTWLNGSFIDGTFTDAEKSRIHTVTLKNENNQMYDTYGGNDTSDKVFLLSISEVLQYFSSDKDRRCLPSIHTSLYGAWKFPDGACWWFLRSPGELQHTAATVYEDGSVNYEGQCVSDRTYGIRPAMWIELD